ncbi:MAG: long-chain fatty acid--CoA ligase [Ignavibacteriales bacterium]|nr:long-chain fatty acid--CoA ligase [Ignavibacteriales bacterium]
MSAVVEFSTLSEMFDNITKRYADSTRPMLMTKIEGAYRGMTHAEYRRKVELFAMGLAALGIKQGDRLSIVSENRPEWVIADMAMVILRVVNVPIYPTLTPKQIEFIYNDAGVKAAIVSNLFQLNKVIKIKPDVPTLERAVIMTEKGATLSDTVLPFSKIYDLGAEFEKTHPAYVLESIPKAKPDDLLTLIYTSGTTGNPKGVMLTHGNLVSNVKASADVIPFGETDVLLSFLPLCHSFERMAGYYTAMACGATVAYAESVETVRDNLMEVRPTIVTTVPRLFERIYNRMMKQVDSSPPARQKIFHWAVDIGKRYSAAKRSGRVPVPLGVKRVAAARLVFSKLKQRTGGRIRFFVSGGAALPRLLGEFFEGVGIQIIEGYGLTETSPVLTVNRLDDYKFGTVGRTIPGVEVKIADDGEILARGPNIMKGYYNNPQATKEAIDPDGWFHTGDVGMFDQEGHLVITDRKKHLFVSSGGKNIAPQPIENLFLSNSKFIDQFVLIGDGRMFLTALIVPEFEVLKEFARQNGIRVGSESDLVVESNIRELYRKEIDRIQRDLPTFERVRRFELLNQALTVENGEITPTMKVKRKVVEEKFAPLIEKMYEDVT